MPRKSAERRLVAACSLYILSWMRMAVVLAWFQKRSKMRRLVTCSMIWNNKITRRFWMRDRNREQSWWDTVVPHFNNEQWIESFRMRKDTFYELVNLLEDDMRPFNFIRAPLPTAKRIAVGIFHIASGKRYDETAEYFGIEKGTVFIHCHKFCLAMLKRRSKFISLPGMEQATQTSQRFEQEWKCPQVIGAIGSFHVAGLFPEKELKTYQNTLGWKSIVLQAVVDDKYRFRDVFSDMPGGMDHHSILKESDLYREETLPQHFATLNGTDIPSYLAGSSEYPILPWLITPYEGNHLTLEQESFNWHLLHIQNYAQTAFLRLKARWKLLRKRIQLRKTNISDFLTVCCMLHNLCEEARAPVLDEWLISADSLQPAPNKCHEMAGDGVETRDMLCEYMAEKYPLRKCEYVVEVQWESPSDSSDYD